MQFLALTQRNLKDFTLDDYTAELLEEESQRVRQLYTEGVLRQIWRRADLPGACLLLEAANESDATAAVQSLPLAKRGMLSFQVMTQLIPYPGFGPR